MKIWKLVLAALLAAGTVAAFLYFPNPLDQARAESAASQDASSDAPPAAESPAPQPPASGGEST